MMRFFSEYFHALMLLFILKRKYQNILKDKFITFNTMKLILKNLMKLNENLVSHIRWIYTILRMDIFLC